MIAIIEEQPTTVPASPSNDGQPTADLVGEPVVREPAIDLTVARGVGSTLYISSPSRRELTRQIAAGNARRARLGLR
jgi:hypothetical protein